MARLDFILCNILNRELEISQLRIEGYTLHREEKKARQSWTRQTEWSSSSIMTTKKTLWWSNHQGFIITGHLVANLLPASARTYWGPADSLPLTSPTNKATTLLWLSPHNGSTLLFSMCYNRSALLVALMGQCFDSGRQKSFSLHHILEEKVSWRLGRRILSPPTQQPAT